MTDKDVCTRSVDTPPETWCVKYEHGKLNFKSFESALAYANGLAKGSLNKRIIDPKEKLIEVWLDPLQAGTVVSPC